MIIDFVVDAEMINVIIDGQRQSQFEGINKLPNIYSAFGVYIIAESQSTLELRSSSQFLKLLRVSLDE